MPYCHRNHKNPLHLLNPFAPIHPSWCFYAGVTGIISGFASCFITNQTIFSHRAWLAAAAVMLIFSMIIARRGLMILAFVAGLMIANVRLEPEFYGREVLSSLVGQPVIVEGTINEEPSINGSTTKLQLNTLSLRFQQGDTLDLAGTIYVQLSTSSELEKSDRITLVGNLSAGFGIFNGTMFRPELIAIERAEYGDVFARLKRDFASAIKNLIASPEVDLGLGYLMGDDAGMSDEFTEQLRAVGMTHIVVASGAHLGILVGVVRKIFGKVSRFAELLGATLAILAFALMIGFTPSMTRAVLVAMLGLLANYVGRRFSPLRLITLVAAITLLISPMNLLNLGWQLSFASFLAILALVPRVGRLLYGGKEPPWLSSMMLTSIMAGLTCAPILIYNFGTVTLLSLVANLIILPTLPYAMALTFLTGAVSMITFVAEFIARLASLLLDLHIMVINFLSEQKMFMMELAAGDGRIFLLYIPIIIGLGWLMYRERVTSLNKIPP